MKCSNCKFWNKSRPTVDAGFCEQIFAKYELIPLPDRIDEHGKTWKTSKLLKVRDGISISNVRSNSKIYTSGDWGCLNFKSIEGDAK